MLYFREDELKRLARFGKGKARAMAVYGRRRAGKTKLMEHFIQQESNCVYYQCTSQNYAVCLEDFAAAIVQRLPNESILTSFRTFRDVFQYLGRAVQEPLILIIDEFPFLAKRDENVAVEFQWIIDHGLGAHKLILLGSNVSFMRRQLYDRELPLYGRFDEIMEVRPFRFSEVCQLFPSFEDAVSVYGQTGGVAQYVMYFLQYETVEEATKALFFNPDGRLSGECENMLMQELREITVYSSVLRAIGRGEKTSVQIAQKARMESKSVPTYLNRLIDLGFVSRVEKEFQEKKEENRYAVTDLLFRFHYAFIEPNLSMIHAIGEKAYEYVMKDNYTEYMGMVYEQVIRMGCFDYALQGTIPFMPLHVGKWWGKVFRDGQWVESEVDVVAYDDHRVLIGECKYKNKRMGMKEYEDLKLKGQSIPTKGRKMTYLMASRSGFTEDVLSMKDEALVLIEKC